MNFRLLLSLALWISSHGNTAAVEIEILGNGTDALLGGDLTDPEDDGNETAGAQDPSWNWITIDSDDEPGFEGNESAYNVFDNQLGPGNDKWCCTDATAEDPRHITVEFAAPVRLTHFTLSSANDAPDRDPIHWQILGSQNGAQFSPIVIYQEDQAVWDQRLQVILFTLDQPAPPYRFLRYQASNTPGSLHQLGEIEYFGEPGDDIDSDDDGISDFWEILHGLDPSINDAQLDPDADDLSNLQEFKAPRTDPQNPDSDDDGLEDGLEVNTYQTDPTTKDTDGDTLADGFEVDQLLTDPLRTDSDGDSFDENIELALGTNPLDPNDRPSAITALRSGAWHTPTVWSNGQSVTPGNNYVAIGSVVSRLETAEDGTGGFNGNRLTLVGPGLTLSLNHFRIAGVLELISQSATIEAHRSPTGLKGSFTALGNSHILVASRNVDLRSRLIGKGTLRVSGTSSGSLRLNGIANTYDGDWIVQSTNLIANTAGALGTGSLTLVNAHLDVSAPNYSPNATLDIQGENFSLHLDADIVYRDLRGLDEHGNELFRLSELAEGVNSYTSQELRAILEITDDGAVSGTGRLIIDPDGTSDNDADGLPDAWELANLGNLSSDGSGDHDGDGLTNALEFRTGANPNLTDTDADGLTDEDEIHRHGSSPVMADTDGDGDSDETEVLAMSDPNDPGAFTVNPDQAGAQDVTHPTDAIVIVNGHNDNDASQGPPPGAEGVEHAIDNVGQKYLNFLDFNSGFNVTPQIGATVLNSIRVYPANDAPGRDPAAYRLTGSNDGTRFTLISEGALSLPDDRNAGSDAPLTIFEEIRFANTTAYTSYQVTFPDLKDADTAVAMQVGEVELIGLPALDQQAPTSPDTISGVNRMSIVSFGLTFPPGQMVNVEFSTDLVSWEMIANDVQGDFIDPDPKRTQLMSGYYRGVLREN